jgi:7-carboxy-7-deazaguanine synthase
MLRVNEVFHSIQGEGTRAGEPCVFVRLTGCPLRCTWCDTAYAFDEGDRLSQDEVVARIARFGCRLVEITGGEPLSQAGTWPLVAMLLDGGYEVLVETSGHVSLEGRDPRAVVIMDIKAPGSGESDRMDWDNVPRLLPSDEVKLVVADRKDYEWSRKVLSDHGLPDRCAVLLAPVHGRLDPAVLAQWLLVDGLRARLQVQLHKILWPHRERGV